VHPSLGMNWLRDPTARITTWTRASSGAVNRRTLPHGRITHYAYDARGNLTEVREDATNARWRFEYDTLFNNLTRQTDPSGGVATIEYDTNGNPNWLVPPDTLRWAFDYDTRGQLVRAFTAEAFQARNAADLYNSTVYDTLGNWNPVEQTTYRYGSQGIRTTLQHDGRWAARWG
jgi:YD repeat-containing protein